MQLSIKYKSQTCTQYIMLNTNIIFLWRRIPIHSPELPILTIQIFYHKNITNETLVLTIYAYILLTQNLFKK